MYRTYETIYGVQDHNGGGCNPLSSVAYTDVESSRGRTKLMDRMDTYRELDIYRTWHLSMTEFLGLPRDMVLYIIETTEKSIIENTAKNDANDIEDMFSQRT